MKKILLLLLTVAAFFVANTQNTDLPGPSSNLQTLPAGSYVIAMDNILQVNSSGDFNLKAYGLIVYLLNNDIRVKWSIKAGKTKDGIDFTATADQIKPTLISGGLSRDFKAGPFVISASDTTGVASLIDAFYTANSLTGLNRPQVYRLTAAASNVDIRYDLMGYRPKAAILTDGGNQSIHLAYMTAAAIPSASYSTSTGVGLIAGCYTFASEPHNTNTGTAVNNAITAIKDFVLHGGNFLAQCEAIDNYENNSLGRFQTTGGITSSNTNIGTTLTYANPDLSFSQFEGSYNASQGGSLKNWKVIGTTTNNEHNHATGTGANIGVIGASVSKNYYGKGGLVFYIGNHSFATTSLAGINGIRMYMNAFLTPANTNCPSLLSFPLGLKLTQFSGMTKNDKTILSWTVDENELAEGFQVQRSSDGVNFNLVGYVLSSTKSGTATYQFSEKHINLKSFYRIKMIGQQGRSQYSSILTLSETNSQRSLTILSNEGIHDVSLSYATDRNIGLNLFVYNSFGTSVYSTKLKCTEGVNIITVPSNRLIQKGVYYMESIDSDGNHSTAKVLKL